MICWYPGRILGGCVDAIQGGQVTVVVKEVTGGALPRGRPMAGDHGSDGRRRDLRHLRDRGLVACFGTPVVDRLAASALGRGSSRAGRHRVEACDEPASGAVDGRRRRYLLSALPAGQPATDGLRRGVLP